MTKKKRTVADIVEMKGSGEKITMLTAYDACFASILDQSGIDIILVGDSLGMVMLGYDSTIPVTMDEMIHHSKAARRGVKEALLVGDLPFLSYQSGSRDAIVNAGRFVKEAGCDAVKLEGGIEVCEIVEAVVRAGISVMGHIGLTPQTAGRLGGFRVQGKDAESAREILKAAKKLEEAGAFALVLECIPDRLAEVITESVSIPTLGIGGGPACDGQVLVTHDLLGLFERFKPRFVKTYVNLLPQVKEAIDLFKEEVKTGRFPEEKHSFTIDEEAWSLLDLNNTLT